MCDFIRANTHYLVHATAPGNYLQQHTRFTSSSRSKYFRRYDLIQILCETWSRQLKQPLAWLAPVPLAILGECIGSNSHIGILYRNIELTVIALLLRVRSRYSTFSTPSLDACVFRNFAGLPLPPQCTISVSLIYGDAGPQTHLRCIHLGSLMKPSVLRHACLSSFRKLPRSLTECK